jgi:hypothetical protein
MHLFNRHRTKWTVVVDRPRVVATLTLFDTQAAADAEIVRLRQDGVGHVFALPPQRLGRLTDPRGIA